jgi:hypothetical protein
MASERCQGYSCVMIPPKINLLLEPTGDLLAIRSGLAAGVGELEQVLLGSLVEQTRRCGKAACRCVAGLPHGPYPYLSARNGTRGMRYVPTAMLAPVKEFLRHGEQVEATLAEISAINLELLARRYLGLGSPGRAAWCDLVRLGVVRLGVVRLGVVRLGVVRLGVVRLGVVRLGVVPPRGRIWTEDPCSTEEKGSDQTPFLPSGTDLPSKARRVQRRGAAFSRHSRFLERALARPARMLHCRRG